MRIATLGLAGKAVGSWLFFAIGVSPAALLAAVTFSWAAVRVSLGRPAPWVTFRTTPVRKYLLPIIVATTAVPLAGCAGQAQYDLQFLKTYGPGKGMQIMILRQSAPIHSSQPATQATPLTTVSFGPTSDVTAALSADAAVTPSTAPR